MTRSRSQIVTLSYIIKAKFRRKLTPPLSSSSTSVSTSDSLTTTKPLLPFLKTNNRINSGFSIIPLLLFFIFISSAVVNCSSPFLTPNNNNIAAKQAEEEGQTVRRCNNTQCYHGTCMGGDHCLCDFGWTGVNCAQCGGRIRLSAPYGQITDGLGNYSSELQCTWLIESTGEVNASTIRLSFNAFETECSWDHLYVFDGDSLYAPMLAALSGSLVKSSDTTVSTSTTSMPEITATSGRAYLYFYSDAAFNMSGFDITYHVNACPRNCSARGVCVGGVCTCDAGFTGDACQRPICPEDCGREQGRGFCDRGLHRCVCHYGYVGADCSQAVATGYWALVKIAGGVSPAGRALHQAVVHQEAMYVVGGEHFAAEEPFLRRFDLRRRKWEAIGTEESGNSQPQPAPRFGHSVVVYGSVLTLFGGLLRNGTISAELWEIDLEEVGTLRRFGSGSGGWRPVTGTRSLSNSDFCCPIAAVGHTATLVSNVMIVIFGYNPNYGFLHHVQYYYLDSKQWKLVKATGASVKGGFGHTANYDHLTRLIYVFGGYHSVNFSDNQLVDLLYAFDPKKESWSLLSPSHSPRYLHSASIINGMLLVYGGNGHNATDDNSGDVCFSATFLAYDISCDTWRSLPLPSASALGYSETPSETGDNSHHQKHHNYQQLLGRYGHSSVIFEEALYIFGGFSGMMHSSLLRYVPGNCSHLTNYEDCSAASFTSSAKCHWSKEKGGVCQALSQVMKASAVAPLSASSTSYSIAFNFCPENLATNFSELCSRQTLCANCLTNSFECVWCGGSDRDSRCRHRSCDSGVRKNRPVQEEENPMLPKAEHHHHHFHHSSASRSSALSSLFGGGGEAEELKSSMGNSGIRDVNSCETRDAHLSNCDRLHNCHACHTEHNCSWQRDRKCSLMSSTSSGGGTSITGDFVGWQPASGNGGGSSKHIKNEKLTSTTSASSSASASASASSSADSDEPSRALCEPACHTRTTCENCTQGTCMWCSSLRQCIESNAYAALYPIGQCMEWTTHAYKCSALSCTDIQSCDRCLKSPQCGWCDNGSGMGVGVCLEGAARGPFALNSSTSVNRGSHHGHSHSHSHPHPHHQPHQLDLKRCPAANWHFSSCPACDCNGHAECHPLPPGAPAALAPACKKCHHRTEGERCERCVEGFYGNPVNGGSCAPCSCGGHSDLCHRETGKCSCSTKGITGHHCERCDEANNYVGNPSGDLHDGTGGGGASCFYNLSTSYSYTFNMSKPDDAYYTRINFMNAPLSTEIDIEFTVTCQESALVNISVGSAYNTTFNITRPLYDSLACGNIKLRFTHDEHFFNIVNATFFVKVFNFRTPFVLQISFSQHRNLDILQFFLTFSSCFLALLIIAAILWKIKQKYELYRRRQQLFVEMEQMASRPFAGVVLQMKTPPSPPLSGGLPPNPTPIALEPCSSGKAAVLTLIVKLPTGDGDCPPSGQTGIAMASALVTLGNVSLEQNCRAEMERDGLGGPLCTKHQAAANRRANKLNNSSTGV